MQSLKNNQEVKLTGKLKWVERISYLLDENFRLPGTKFRFGLDPIMNLIPFAGDISGFLIGAALVYTMATQGVSRKVLILMLFNVFLDAILGGIPFIGQVFDFYYKSNSRNIRLLKEHYQEGKHQGNGTGVLVTIFMVLLIFFIGFVFLLYKLSQWLLHFF